MIRIRRFVILILLTFTIIATIAFVFVLNHKSMSINFLENVIAGDEAPAFAALSDEMKVSIKSHCPNGKVTGCINELVSTEWGQLNAVHFVIGVFDAANRNAELYYTFWSGLSTPISIVLITEEANGGQVISGWRGFILSEGEDADSDLVRGKRHDNELLTP